MAPKISFIIPVYNVEEYLEECMDSVINQSLKDIEIICINDGSTDNSLEILKRYQKKDSRIKIINQENAGLSKSRNNGLKIASGEYILFVDSDDWVDLDLGKELYDLAKKDDLDVVIFHIINFDDDQNKFYETKYYNNAWFPKYFDDKIFSREDLPEYIFSLTCTAYSKFYKRSLINKYDISFPNGLYFEDNPFHCEVLLTAQRIRIVRKHYYYRRRREGSITSDADEKYFDTIKISNILIDVFKKYGVYDKYKKIILNRKLEYIIYSYETIEDSFKNEFIKLLCDDFDLIKSNEEFHKDVLHNLEGINKYFFVNLNRFMDYTELNFLITKYKLSLNDDKNIPYIHEVNVAVIMDPLSFNSYNSEFNTFPLEPDNWKEIFRDNDIDLFFCESTWHGVGKGNIKEGIAIENDYSPWSNKIIFDFNDDEHTLDNILTYCNENNIPTIFWNKENPFAFEEFINAALKFDYIFTTDFDSIIKYNLKGHNNVYPLLFASQIKLYNPIESQERSNDVIFAGSWYSNFEERCAIMHNFFKLILENNYNLKIYNRHSSQAETMPYWQFPKEYDEYINPAVNSNEMAKVYKESKIALNINSVTSSPTMFARRVFELMSSNTFILSNFSEGVYNLFSDNVLYLDRVDSLNLEENTINEICETNLYDVLENHTYYDRFKYILNTINFQFKEKKFKISLIYFLNQSVNIEGIVNDFNSFSYFHKQCIIVTEDKNLINYLGKIKFISFEDLVHLNELFDDMDFFMFRFMKVNLKNDFIKKAFLHYKYLDKQIGIQQGENKYTIYSTNEYYNIIFNAINFSIVLNNISNIFDERLEVYKI